MSKPNPGGANHVVGQRTNRSTLANNTKNASYGTSGGNRSNGTGGSGGKKS